MRFNTNFLAFGSGLLFWATLYIISTESVYKKLN